MKRYENGKVAKYVQSEKKAQLPVLKILQSDINMSWTAAPNTQNAVTHKSSREGSFDSHLLRKQTRNSKLPCNNREV